MIEYAAPGKAVIWGEYAVLAGAPALVMAVDRYARTAVSVGGDAWHLRARGFEDEVSLDVQTLQALDPGGGQTGVAGLVRSVLAALGDPPLPAGMTISTDTTVFHDHGHKLGIGSSAAICTATCAALADALGCAFDPTIPRRAHQLLQGKAGSGLDVAAACAGGLIRFQSGQPPVSAAWPDGLHYRFFWVGHSARTTDHLARFAARPAEGDRALDDLCAAANALFIAADLPALREYVARLKALDVTARLGIYDAAHARLDELASRVQVVYKPCGAGGGDIGIAVSDDASNLASLLALAARDTFLPLNLEIAPHGVHRISS